MSTTTIPATTETPAPEPEAPTYGALLAADRCDWCIAQAFVRAVHPANLAWHGMMNQDLLFCAHHYKKVEAKLEGWTIFDERDKIN